MATRDERSGRPRLRALAARSALAAASALAACSRTVPALSVGSARPVRSESPQAPSLAEGAARLGTGPATDAAEDPAQVRRLRERVATLERELAFERAQRLERELAWYDYTRTLGVLGGEEGPIGPPPAAWVPNGSCGLTARAQDDGLVAEALRPLLEGPLAAPSGDWSALEGAGADERAQVPPAAPAAATPGDVGAAADTAEVRAARLTRLRALLASEGLRGMDLLEIGQLDGGASGPVVFRLLDEGGRLVGGLFARRLHFEASRAGRALTMVLEDGWEARGGERRAFGAPDGNGSGADGAANDVREPLRIDFQEVDVEAWLEALPELFEGTPVDFPPDDGAWDLAYVRLEFNRLARTDASAGWVRLRRLGGVVGGVLRDVHLESLRPDGSLEQRLFADRLRIEPALDADGRPQRGVVLALEDGVTLRGEDRQPFVSGRLGIVLPRARASEWIAAGLPGCVPTPSGPAVAARVSNARLPGMPPASATPADPEQR